MPHTACYSAYTDYTWLCGRGAEPPAFAPPVLMPVFAEVTSGPTKLQQLPVSDTMLLVEVCAKHLSRHAEQVALQ